MCDVKESMWLRGVKARWDLGDFEIGNCCTSGPHHCPYICPDWNL